MAAVLIHGSAEAADSRELSSPRRRMIQVDDDTRYVFYLDSAAGFQYEKSTDANATWGPAVSLGTGAATEILYDLYYKRWNDSGAANIVDLYRWVDAGTNRGLYHRQLNLNTDTLSTEVYVQVLGAAGAAGGGGIGVARSGRIYMCGGNSVTGTVMVYSDNEGVSWSTAPVTFTVSDEDSCEMWADFASDDPNDICAIYYRGTSGPLSIKRYDASAGTITTTTIAASVTGDGAFGADMMSMLASDGTIKVAYWDARTSPANLKTATVSGATVTTRTNVLTNTSYGEGVAIAKTESGRIYVFYGRDSGGASETALEVRYKYSTDDMVTWSSEALYGSRDSDVTGLLIDPRPADNTISPAWFEGVGDDLYIEAPIVSASNDLTAALPIRFTLSGTLTGGSSAQPPIVIKCRPLAGAYVISATLDSR